jgi:hypothetical protein
MNLIINGSQPSLVRTRSLATFSPPPPSTTLQKGVSFGSAGTTRAPARMGMDIANLKSSRGCSSCGK